MTTRKTTWIAEAFFWLRLLACRFRFTPLAGTAEVSVRLRLIKSQNIRTLARMNDGRVLMAHRHITVTAGGCGM